MTFFWLTAITASRVLCAGFWLWCWWKRPKRMVLWMFLLAAWFLFTDHYDGQWAREYGLESDLGKYLDHGADVLFYGAVFLGVIAGSREPDAKRRPRRVRGPSSKPTPPTPPPVPPPPPV